MNNETRKLVESAILIAVGVVLSLFSFSGPWVKGGSITITSMLPLVIISFRYGTKWGTFSALVYAVIQAVLGASNLGYAPNAVTWLAILLLDYIIPFTIIGMASAFKSLTQNKVLNIVLSICITFGIRLFSHFISGWLIWQTLWPEAGWIAWVFSLAYNASYMIPEMVISSLVAYISYIPLKKYWEGGQ